MSDIGCGSLPLNSSELCVEHQMSDSETNMTKKRRKNSFSKSVAMESENPEAHLEPTTIVVLKRKRTSGHNINREIKNKEIAPAKEIGDCSRTGDGKLEVLIIRYIYGEGTERADTKLKHLEDSLKKKMEQQNLQKEFEQLAATNEERKKRARWLAGEPTANEVPESVPTTLLLPQASEDRISCSSTSDVIQDIGAQVVQEQPNIELHVKQDVPNFDAEESSEKLQDQNATDLKDQSIEVANSEPVDIVNPVPSINVGAPASQNFGLGSGSHINPGRTSSSSQNNNVNVSQIAQLPHQPAQFYGSGCAPLQHALLNKSEEIKQLQKSHQHQKSQLISDREKEIQVINNKYNLKIQEAEAEYNYQKNGLEKNRKKILMNKLLAECFKGKDACMDPFEFRGIQQAGSSSSSSSMQHQTRQNMMRPPPAFSLAGSSSSSSMQQKQQNMMRPPVHTPAFSMGTSQPTLRPLLINARAGGNVRSGAQPHASPTPILRYPNIQAIQQQQLQPSNTAFGYSPITVPPVHAPPNFSLGSTSRRPLSAPSVRSVARPLTSSFMPAPTFPSFHQNFHTMQPSTFQNMPQLQGQPPSGSVALNPIYISDDDD